MMIKTNALLGYLGKQVLTVLTRDKMESQLELLDRLSLTCLKRALETEWHNGMPGGSGRRHV